MVLHFITKITPGEVSSLELPDIERPAALRREEVGPCSQLTEFTFQDVKDRFVRNE
jgi:hypothetical protein